ncbi:uncharacterized protein LOC106076304 [Biomphalaria glabrata]|uniref:Uncharacterized protein LOC106076304 n=1 Tax=Biomphalaria glabrata TaxID=6526 RepID=A0A9W3ABD3_BIOGL|nr:uncharacterized protein LOC106076304 [Biomphalaria glabrata]
MVWLMLISLLGVIENTACQGACPAGWFGPKCQFQCHCQIKCDSTGECQHKLCSIGWFGYKCQYQDFVSRFKVPVSEIKSQLPRWSNGDDSDCIEDERIKVIKIHLKATIYFTWISLTVKNTALLTRFRLTLLNKTRRWECEKLTFASIARDTVNIRCNGRELINKIILKGDGVTTLCSIHVSGGRNMALKQRVTTDLTQIIPDVTLIADGNRDTNLEESCTSVGDVKMLPSKSWSLTFEEPVVASNIEILSKGNFTRSGILFLETFDQNKVILFNTRDPYNVQLYPYHHKAPISGIKVTYKKINSRYLILSLCEVSVYGECVPGRWGLDCKQSCGSQCPGSCNEFDGTCPVGCLGYKDGPICSKKCEQDTWGVNCQERCSEKCAFNMCARRNGLCSAGCNAYSDPPYCTQDCKGENYGRDCLCDGKDRTEACNPEITGKVTVFTKRPSSCRDVVSTQERVVVRLVSGFKVMCDTKSFGGGWIIFQRRINGKVSFSRGWDEYRNGFGDYDIGEFYLGNENLFKLTSRRRYELRVDLEFGKRNYSIPFLKFRIMSEREKYKLEIESTAPYSDSLTYHNDMKFSTFDNDNDLDTGGNCAAVFTVGWWYRSCHTSNLNGLWGNSDFGFGLNWDSITNTSSSATFTEMKIREV